ncbi:hypothetical protein [Moraxella porci]|uniref:hypothetical protein n=1 Tax=Moraxella porci TaxID=1288392 RepID=UPI00244B2FBB|nr:hypothetical protein [Moraxella porci]MDH2274537.1 hypothetical protein [Moraxella porci]
MEDNRIFINHEIAHHNGLGETSATAMGKISDFAYNIGTSLNTDDINTHRQTITPTEITLQSLSTDEQLTITQDNQALLNANEVQRAWEVENGDGVWDHDPDLGKTDQKLADETRKMNETWAIIQKNKQYILIGTSLLPVVGDIQ